MRSKAIAEHGVQLEGRAVPTDAPEDLMGPSSDMG